MEVTQNSAEVRGYTAYGWALSSASSGTAAVDFQPLDRDSNHPVAVASLHLVSFCSLQWHLFLRQEAILYISRFKTTWRISVCVTQLSDLLTRNIENLLTKHFGQLPDAFITIVVVVVGAGCSTTNVASDGALMAGSLDGGYEG